MDSTANIYAERTALEAVLSRAFENEGLLTIIEILKRHAKICIDMTDAERKTVFVPEDFDNIDIICTLFNAFGIEPPIALKSFFEQIEDQEETIVSKPNSLFLKDCSIERAEELRNKYGVWVISKEEVSDRLFEGASFKDEFVPFDSYGPSDNGWKNIITKNDLRLPPSNSLILSDNFLLFNKRGEHVLGLVNLIHLLDAILPEKLSIPFYILILSPAKNGEEEMMIRKITQWKEDLIKALNRDYVIQIEFILSQKVIHKRIIYMNYAYIGTEKGFKIFMPFSNRVYSDGDQKNSAWFYSYFHDPFRKGRREHELATDDIELVKGIYKQARENQGKTDLREGQPKFVGSPLGAVFSPNRIFE